MRAGEGLASRAGQGRHHADRTVIGRERRSRLPLRSYQLPLADGSAVGSKQKAFKVFQREEGGFHRCRVDNVTIGVHFMWDWIDDVLKPGT